MNLNWRRITTTLGFVSCLAMVAPACVLRAQGTAAVRPAHVVVVDVEPPPPQYVTVRTRPGMVWVKGHHEMRNGRWVWIRGRWVTARAGYHYMHPHWERRGNRWYFVQGRWVRGGARVHARPRPAPPPPRPRKDIVRPRPQPRPAPPPPAADYPTQAPPPVRAERPGTRPGHVWIAGHWVWNGRWTWQAGRWERSRIGYRWQPGRWEHRGNRYVWVKGRWVQSAKVIKPRRDKPRPKRKSY